MEIRLLGPVEAVDDVGPVSLGGRKQRTLIAVLASRVGEAVSIDRCIDAVWGDTAPAGAQRSLQTYASNIRRLLDPDGAGRLVGSRQSYTFTAGAGLTVDSNTFEQLIAMPAAGEQERRRQLEDAIALWRGRPLGDIGDDAWARGLVSHWEQLRLRALTELGDLRVDAGEAEDVIAETERLLVDHPYHEAFWRQHMVALYQLGRQADALAAYQRFKALIGEELGLEPSPELARIEERILLRDPSLQRRDRTPNNLPADLTTIIGREQDIQEVAHLIGSVRCLTLVGSGGVGKTRLGIAAARSVVKQFRDGVWFVDLARLDSTDHVLPAVADVIGIEPPALRSLEAAVSEAVAESRVLFVVDNCEHVVTAAAPVVQMLLQAGDGVAVLATSREVMGVPGEHAWRVPSLDVPDIDTSDGIVESDSVRLFVERAQAAEHSFAVTDDIAPAVASVCRQLDGIPLAIELAAARTTTLSPAELDTALGETFDVLKGGGRTQLPRHRTIRATLDWSYKLMGDELRGFFDELGRFAGPFTLEGAAALTGRDRREAAEMVEKLVAKSMLTPIAGSPRRFRMLETLRQYAVARLEAAGRLAEVHDAHLEWVAALTMTETPRLLTGDQLEVLGELREDLDDIRLALEWSVTSGRADIGLRIAALLARFWYLTGMHAEGAAWFDRLIALDPQVSHLEMGRALTAAALTLNRVGRDDEAHDLARRAVELLRPLDEPQALGWAQFYLAVTSTEEGYANLEEVEAGYQDARASFEKANYHPGVVLSRVLLSGIAVVSDPTEAFVMAEPLYKEATAAGNANVAAHCLEFIAMAQQKQQDLGAAADALTKAIRLHGQVGNWACLGHCLQGVGHFLVGAGRPAEAARIVGGVDALRLRLSTVEAPYERFIMAWYEWVGTIESDPDLSAARDEGLTWDRYELVGYALAALERGSRD